MQQIELEVVRTSLFDTRPLDRGRLARLTVLSGPDAGDYEVRLDGADRRYLYLIARGRRGLPVHPAPGTPVYVAAGEQGSRCEFGSVVAQLQPEACGDECMAILLPLEAQRMQRRKFMRVELAMPIRVARLPKQDEPADTLLRLLDGTTTNIAGGGLSFTCRQLSAQPGDLIALTIALPPRRHVTATAEVLRCEPAGVYAVEFCDIDEQAQADLACYVREHRHEAAPGGNARQGFAADARRQRGLRR